jgi:hypothetical protein
MGRKKETHPVPWKHISESKDMSAIVDANDVLVCGSLICKEYSAMTRNTHELIVKRMNEGSYLK